MKIHSIYKYKCFNQTGQSTIEAAYVAPILLGCILMLTQPVIVLYDRVIMQSAAGDACRLACVLDENSLDQIIDNYVRNRLSAIPQQDNFHVHGGACSYEVNVEGSQSTENVTVSISNKVKPLPLIDFLCKSVGATNSDGYWEVKVESKLQTQPEWAANSPSGQNPESWVGDWI